MTARGIAGRALETIETGPDEKVSLTSAREDAAEPLGGRRKSGMSDRFRVVAQRVSHQAGSPLTILGAFALVLFWLLSGPFFGYSDAWQLFINTGTTIVTFLMVFLIQNAQNRDTKALHLKLDELIRGVQGARTRLVSLEQCSDEELNQLETEFQRLRHRLTEGGREEPRERARQCSQEQAGPADGPSLR